MKKIISFVALVLCLAMICSMASATQGTSGRTSEFYVRSEEAGSYIRIKSYEGIANIGNTSLLSTVTNKTEDNHGAYTIEIRDASTGSYIKSIVWAPCISSLMKLNPDHADEYGTTIDVEFPAANDYMIRIIPLDPSKFWVADNFYSWLTEASWEVTKTNDCEVTNASLVSTNTSSTSQNTTPSYCSHESNSVVLASTEIVSQGNETCHVVKEYYDINCSICGTYLSTDNFYREEVHTFDGDTCVWCGFVRPNSSHNNFSSQESSTKVEEVVKVVEEVCEVQPALKGNSYTPSTNVDVLANLPVLYEQGSSTISNGSGNLSVYTGPGSNYYRSASGKAAVSNGEQVTVYGRSGDYLLIKYEGKVDGSRIHRFAYAPVNKVSNGNGYSTLNFGYVPIRISTSATLVDEPDSSRRGFTSIDFNLNNAFALACCYDYSGQEWIYFETDGYSEVTNKNNVPVRGFVLKRYVSVR